LSLAYLTQHDDLQFHPFSCKLHNFIFLHGWVIFHPWYVYKYIHMYIYMYINIIYIYCLSIHQVLSTSADSTIWLLWRQSTCVSKYLSYILIYTSLDICQAWYSRIIR
jgi:hypothetical protein